MLMLAVVMAFGGPSTVHAEQLFQLRNGLVLRGTKVEIASLKEGFAAASASESNVRPVWLIDDGLRRHYIHGRSMVAADPVDVAGLGSTIEFYQPKPLGGKAVGGLGTILGISDFNRSGRRQLRMRGPTGTIDVMQGIAEINPRYAKLVALNGKTALLWDMRVATSSIDSETLSMIFQNRVAQDDINARLELVRFFKDTGRFGEAQEALRKTIDDFPNEKELGPLLISLAARQGAQLIEEAKHRLEVGQRSLARSILERFPLDQIGRVQRIEVSEAIEQMDKADQEVREMLDRLTTQIDSLGELRAGELKPALAEIKAGLSPETAIRMSDFKRLSGDENMPVENRVALGLSGWILGPGQGEPNLNIAQSLFTVRDLVRRYLVTEDANTRRDLISKMRNLEGATAPLIDRMLPWMEPVLPFPEGSADPEIAGLYRVKINDIDYHVQLPPEYNPRVSYPCVLSLGVAGGDPAAQVAWWCGDPAEPGGDRLGHAARNGFVVVAPVWSRASQRRYEYTTMEHHRVLAALRDAMRRVSIDADRVFMAGHGEGATAGWDISLAHPDLWAGLIAISGNPSQTVPHYELNARYLPKYLVMGELDGDKANGAILDDYISFRHDAMVVMYRGRGREFFFDEAPRLFEWMRSRTNVRREIPDKIETATMRRGDQYYWWLELIDLNPQIQIDPVLWEQAERTRAGKVDASISKGNLIRFDGPCDAFELWLRPTRSLNLNQPIKLKHRTRQKTVEFDGGLETILEDVRTRADRKRPFWMRVRYP